MFTIFKEEKVITAGILVFLCLSVLVRLMLAWMYHTMIRETDNMATTGNRLLKQCKVKFANTGANASTMPLSSATCPRVSVTLEDIKSPPLNMN